MKSNLGTILKGAALVVLLLAAFQNCGFTAAKFAEDQLASRRATYKRAVAFDEVFEKVFIPACVTCHNATTGAFDMTSYANATSRIDWVDLENSAILTNVLVGTMPQSGDPLTDEEMDLVMGWVLSGAPNALPAANEAPVISHVNTVDRVQLNANGRAEVSSNVIVTDAGYRVASYRWARLSGNQVEISGASTERVNIRFTQTGTTVVRLTVLGTNGKSTVRDFTYEVQSSGSGTPVPTATPTPRAPTPTPTPGVGTPTPTPRPTATPTPTPQPTATPVSGQATYTWLKTNIFEAKKCTTCHTSMATYAGLTGDTNFVKPRNGAQSGVYIRTASGSMPAGGLAAPLTAQELSALKTWIDNGAANN